MSNKRTKTGRKKINKYGNTNFECLLIFIFLIIL